MKTILKIIVALVVAMIMMVVLIMHDVNGNAVISVFFFGGIGMCAVLGVFDVRVNKKQSNRTIGGVLKDAA